MTYLRIIKNRYGESMQVPEDNLLKEEGNSERKSKALKKLIEIRTIRKAIQDGTASPEEQEVYNELRKKYEDIESDTLID